MGYIALSLVVFLVCFGLSALLTKLCMGIAVRTDFLDHPRGRKKHDRPTPLLGGVAIYLSLAFCVYLPALAIAAFGTSLFEGSQMLKDFAQGTLARLPLLHLIFGTGLAMVIVGLIDDKRGMDPYLKLFLQFAAGCVMYFFGVKITLFVPSQLFSFAVTTFWFVLLINSFNLLDNMDGLSAGVALVVVIMMFFISHFFENFLMAAICAAMGGALLGFLLFNFSPARIFMGDSGSLFIGFMVAAIMALTTYYPSHDYPKYVPCLVPLAVLTVPLYDTFSVVVIRTLQGHSIMQGDRNHFSHRLVRLGMGVKYAVLFIYFITFTTGLSSLFLFWVNLTGAVLVVVQVLCLLGIIVILEYYAGCSASCGNDEDKKGSFPTDAGARQ